MSDAIKAAGKKAREKRPFTICSRCLKREFNGRFCNYCGSDGNTKDSHLFRRNKK